MTTTTTPNGESLAGYQQAIKNIVYQLYATSQEVLQHTDDATYIKQLREDIDKPEPFSGILKPFEPTINQINNIVETVAEVYGYELAHVEKDVEQEFENNFSEVVIKMAMSEFLSH